LVAEEEPKKISLETEYEKRFGIPITDFELSTTSVYFGKESRAWSHDDILVVTRTASGALAKYLVKEQWDGVTKYLETTLTLEEWLAFLNKLYELHINEWEEGYILGRKPYYDSNSKKLDYWEFIIFPSNKKMLRYEGLNAYRPNWDKFIKIMDDMKARIKKDAVVEVIEEPQGYSKNNF